MKFEYDGLTEDKEMAAFVDGAGDLCIKIGAGLTYLLKDGSGFSYDEADFQMYADENGVKKAFYPGDKITITF